MRLRAINVGRPREVLWRGQRVRTAIWKGQVDGPRFVGRLNVDGDGQADLIGHGGEHRAVFVYQLESYRHWERELGRTDFVPGQFGENFTVEGMADDVVCIGDRYRIGDALFEVTQPRVTCYKVGIRMDEPRMPALLVSHGRPGFYLRVLDEGHVTAGNAIEKVADRPERMTVRAVNDLLYTSHHDSADLRRALALPALSPGWRASFQALLASVEAGDGDGNPGLAPAAGGAPAWPGFRSLRVADIARESRAIASFTLEPTDGEPLPAFEPGQYLTVRLRPRDAARPVLRSYSLSAAPDPRRYRISVKREPEGIASTFLHRDLAVGDQLEVGAPRGTFTLDGLAGGPVVLVSAGVGATPLLAMLAQLAGERSERLVWWVHGARSRRDHAFAAEARGLLARLPNARSSIHYSQPGPDDVRGREYHAAGRLTAHGLVAAGVPRDASFYLCGPGGFMDELSAGLHAWGVPLHEIHTETFGPRSSGADGVAPHPPPGRPGRGPRVHFGRSALSVNWDERFANLLELAEASDVPASWSCRTGVCHRCETALVDGAVEYAPAPLDDPASGYVLICCSRPAGEVALDL